MTAAVGRRYTGMTLTDPDLINAGTLRRPGQEGAMPSAGLEQALGDHQRELHVHCYRMLGSYTDADDLVQETFLRAWRNRGGFQPGTNARAWLYRITTNVCIDAIRSRHRQISRRGGEGEVTWLQPYPDSLLDQVPDEAEGPEAAAVARETIELAFIAALQALPPRQRAVLVLSAALGWTPGEVASSLEMTPAAVNSALQRARATLRGRLPRDRSAWSAPELSADERDTLRRFIDVHERGDAAAAAALMRDDIVAHMPPDPVLCRGMAEQLKLIDIAFGPHGMGTWRLVPVGANRQPAAASYLCRPGDTAHRAYKIDVLSVTGGLVAATTTFDAALFGAFGLPEVWSPGLGDAANEQRS
jgi:RNA polymerase sigma-70 factor (TIGR02960 family)